MRVQWRLVSHCDERGGNVLDGAMVRLCENPVETGVTTAMSGKCLGWFGGEIL